MSTMMVGVVLVLAACGGGAREFVGMTRDLGPSVDVHEVNDAGSEDLADDLRQLLDSGVE